MEIRNKNQQIVGNKPVNHGSITSNNQHNGQFLVDTELFNYVGGFCLYFQQPVLRIAAFVLYMSWLQEYQFEACFSGGFKPSARLSKICNISVCSIVFCLRPMVAPTKMWILLQLVLHILPILCAHYICYVYFLLVLVNL